MGVLRRDRFWSALLAAVVSTSAWGQAPAPAAGPTGVAPGAAAVPDFSGMWVHPYFPGFEPPASGPGPVLSKWRRPDGGSITRQLIGDYTNPILKPQAAEKVKMKGDIELAGGTFPTPSDHEVRRVRLNRPHPAHVTPSWYGDSVGHYEGDTLVIDTVGVRTQTGPLP